MSVAAPITYGMHRSSAIKYPYPKTIHASPELVLVLPLKQPALLPSSFIRSPFT
jgi:hypothetical protein